jgi:tRNA (mo5U34)-methyltransferase
MPRVESLPDEELVILNELLPWAAYVVDGRGRRFGAAYSATKRAEAQLVPDPRIVELDRRLPLRDLRVLEVGCFEGIHTSALCGLASSVIAVDSRVENVVKTIVRCSLLGRHPDVWRVDLEEPRNEALDLSCDVMHHVGVLYHLTDPVRHLNEYAPLVRKAIMLDTHVAPDHGRLSTYSSCGEQWSYRRYEEAGRAAPFAGMRDHAKWLRERDLVRLLVSLGFEHTDVAERRSERNGARVLIFAERA